LTTPIVLYLLFGAGFGLASFSRRHLFSEGPTQRNDAAAGPAFKARLFWTLICTCLWPLMLLTGLNSWWILSRRRAQAERERRD
jgi:hypothetical protein